MAEGHELTIQDFETGLSTCSCGQWKWEARRFRLDWIPTKGDVQERAELAFASHLKFLDVEPPTRVACCNCGQATSYDPTYGNLCYRCVRADNE